MKGRNIMDLSEDVILWPFALSSHEVMVAKSITPRMRKHICQLKASLTEAREEIERLNGVLDKVDEITKHIEVKVGSIEHHCNLLIAENGRLKKEKGYTLKEIKDMFFPNRSLASLREKVDAIICPTKPT